ncbi:MAG: hypothetical protein H0X04_02660 [Chthoniobacterales bacterium]|nr:hypothetical protein [Chthoniobacterales bacterium]
MTFLGKIAAELSFCVASAREQGWTDQDGEYEYTAVDLEYVTDKLGRKPTRQEWADAGLRYVGGAHCDD